MPSRTSSSLLHTPMPTLNERCRRSTTRSPTYGAECDEGLLFCRVGARSVRQKAKTTVVERSSCVLGIDLGTSAIKVAAISQPGQVVATARESYSTITTCQGQAEQDCQHWL